MQDDKHPSGTPKDKPEESTRQSIDNARKAMGVESKLSEEPDEETQKRNEKDAEQWRNEG